MQVAIVKYNAGNIYSVVNALKRLGVEPLLTDDAEELQKADRVLFPGQGEARGAMEYLKARRLDEVIRNLTQPVLGICIGQQLLCRHSEEGDVDCIGIFDADVKRFQPQRHEDKVPCMGWNAIDVRCKTEDVKCRLFDGLQPSAIAPQPYVYFVHSYYAEICPYTAGRTEYAGVEFTSVVRKGLLTAYQFHPEKSGAVGEQIIKNFLDQSE